MDCDGIYNVLTRRPPKTFDDLLAKINEFARVEDDYSTSNMANYKGDRGNNKRQKGSSKKNKKEEKNDDWKLSTEAFKGVNTIFNRPIHKIIYGIQANHSSSGQNQWAVI